MKTSAEGMAMIKRFEGLRLTAYTCSGNVFTIGYGHTGLEVHAGMVIAMEQAEQFFMQDLARIEAVVVNV